MRCKIRNPMTTEQQLRQRLRKIAALFEGATTVGERNAAAAAIDRVKRAIDTTSKVDTPLEYHFNLPDHWKRRFFQPCVDDMAWNPIVIVGSDTRPSWSRSPSLSWTARCGRSTWS